MICIVLSCVFRFFLTICSRVMLYFSYQLMCCLVCSGRCSVLFLSCFCVSCIFLCTRSCAISCHVVFLVSTHVLFRALRFLMFHAFSVLLLSFYLILCLSCVSRVFFSRYPFSCHVVPVPLFRPSLTRVYEKQLCLDTFC